MQLVHQLLRGSVVLTIGQVVSYGASFARNIILARIVTKADFGIACSFAMVISLFELSGKMAFGQQIVQAKDGHTSEFVESAQFCQAITALTGGLLILLFSHPFAKLFRVEHLTYAFAVLAICSLLKGVENLGVSLHVRQLSYCKFAMVEAIPQVAITLCVWPLSHWFADYRLILILLLAKSLLTTVLTHLFSSIGFRLKFHLTNVRRIARFGWPLLLDGGMMFLTLQGEQFLVAAFFAMSDLGGYAAAVTLAAAPVFMFLQVLTGIVLPALSQCQDNFAEWVKRYNFFLRCTTLVAVVYAGTMAIAGGTMLRLFYGGKFSDAEPIIVWVSIANALRMIRAMPVLAAMSVADTKTNLISNASRGSGLLFGLGAAMCGCSMQWMAISGLIGEFVACPVAAMLVRRRQQVPVSSIVECIACAAILVGLSISLSWAQVGRGQWYFTAVNVLFFTGISMLALGWRMGLGKWKLLLNSAAVKDS